MRGPVDEMRRNPVGIPDPIAWTRTPASPRDLTPIGRMLYPGGTMRMSGWRLVTTMAWPVIAVCGGLVLLMAFALATLGMATATPPSAVPTMLTVGFFGLALFMYVRGMLMPTMRANRIRNRPAHMLVALPSRQVWIEAIPGPKGRTTQREAVLWRSTCSACGSAVGLVETDSNGRSPTVGVCEMHPFHHVYTFDQDTLRGVWDAEYDEPGVVRRRSDDE